MCFEISSHTTSFIKELKTPPTASKTTSLLGLCNRFWRFRRGFPEFFFSERGTTKERFFSFLLQKRKLEAIDSLRKNLISSLPVECRDDYRRMTLDTDACDVEVGFVLLLDQPDKTYYPIVFCRILTKAKRVKDTMQPESLAIFRVLFLNRPFLLDTKSTIRLDESSIIWLLNLSGSSGRLAQCHSRLSELEFDVTDSAFKKHQAADALSVKGTNSDETTGDSIRKFVQTLNHIGYRKRNKELAHLHKRSVWKWQTRPELRNHFMENKDTSVSEVQLTKWKPMKGKLSDMEEFLIWQTKEGHCFVATT